MAANSATGPLGIVLDRLERPRRSGKGYIARCPAHQDRSASLSLAEGSDGRALIHCFAGCSPADVLGAIGLQLADLYPERHTPLKPDHRRELREYAKQANWRAALNVLALETAVVRMAAGQLKTWQTLSEEDDRRLAVAHDRICDAQAVLG